MMSRTICTFGENRLDSPIVQVLLSVKGHIYMIVSRNVQVCTCGKCGREFIPLRCPQCKSPGWNKDASERKPGRPRKEKVVPMAAKVDRQSLADKLPNTSVGFPVKEGYCPHRKQKGEVCYKCDHKFGMPQINSGG